MAKKIKRSHKNRLTAEAKKLVPKEEQALAEEAIIGKGSEYFSRRRPQRSRLSLVGIGRSGRRDVAERAEELLGRAFELLP